MLTTYESKLKQVSVRQRIKRADKWIGLSGVLWLYISVKRGTRLRRRRPTVRTVPGRRGLYRPTGSLHVITLFAPSYWHIFSKQIIAKFILVHFCSPRQDTICNRSSVFCGRLLFAEFPGDPDVSYRPEEFNLQTNYMLWRTASEILTWLFATGFVTQHCWIRLLWFCWHKRYMVSGSSWMFIMT